MTREDRRILRFGIGCAVFSFAVLYLVAQLMLWRYPLSDADKKCISKTMLELSDCWQAETKKK